MKDEGVSAYAKTRQNLLYSLVYVQIMDEDESWNQNLDLEPCQTHQLGVHLRMLDQGLSIHGNHPG